MTIDRADAAFARVARRRVMTVGVTLAVLPIIAPDQVLAAAAVDHAPENAFLKLSRLLTGHSNLNPQAVERLFGALTSVNPAFTGQTAALADFVHGHGFSTVDTLAAVLDKQDTKLARVLHEIVEAWYSGVVGDGPRAQVIEYRYALMIEPVADVVGPVSYCHAAPFYWASKPPIA